MTGRHRDVYGLLPGLRVGIEAARDDVRCHFDAEYGSASATVDVASPELEVAFRTVEAARVGGGHKSVRWRVDLGEPRPDALRARIELRGAPRSFALSLVQGYFVEPLISLAAPSAGSVLLPCAAIRTDEGLLLLLGKSRSGKSSLAVRALAAGATVLGDDQVFIDADARCTRFPRRMRFYGDLRQTAPRAYARLPSRDRRGLRARGVVRRLTRGFVAPPVRVRVADLGVPAGPEPVSVTRVVLIERLPGITTIEREEASTDMTVEFGLTLLDEQREKLAAAGPDWNAWIRQIRRSEAQMLRRAFEGHEVERVGVPLSWTAGEALPILSYLLGIPS